MYKIADIAEKTGFSKDTIRYYDKMGLLPFAKRDASGQRYFNEYDLNAFMTIRFLKDSQVSLEQIRSIMYMIMEGDNSIEQRLQFFKNHQKLLEEKMRELELSLQMTEWKVNYYEEAVAAGTESVHDGEVGFYDAFKAQAIDGQKMAG